MDIFKTTVASIVTVRDVTVVIEKRACRCSSALSGQLQPTECPPPVTCAPPRYAELPVSERVLLLFHADSKLGTASDLVLPSSSWCAAVSFET